ncbi:MAG: hypothetical protein ACXW1D_00025 [Halobacteriota archaeon]
MESDSTGTFGLGDYYYIKIIDADTNQLIVQFGDYYHDKGHDKLLGFLRGVEYSGVAYACQYEEELSEW